VVRTTVEQIGTTVDATIGTAAASRSSGAYNILTAIKGFVQLDLSNARIKVKCTLTPEEVEQSKGKGHLACPKVPTQMNSLPQQRAPGRARPDGLWGGRGASYVAEVW